MADSLLNQNDICISYYIIFPSICQTFCTFGIISNGINIACFVKQGFNDPVSVSLTALALSDLGGLLMSTLLNICFTPAFGTADLHFDVLDIFYLTGSIPRTTFSRVTAWFTAVITLERCLCITAPLQVKSIITPKRMVILLLSIFIVLVSTSSPMYVVNQMGFKFYSNKNKTLLGVVFTDDRNTVETFSFAINSVFLPFIAFVIISVCTIILAIKLRKRAKWRQISTTSVQADNVSTKNKKVAKMVVVISTLFIVSFLPLCIICLLLCLIPGFTPHGNYLDLISMVGGICLILESINSSINIFIYYNMSSKYQAIFRQLFRLNLKRVVY